MGKPTIDGVPYQGKSDGTQIWALTSETLLALFFVNPEVWKLELKSGITRMGNSSCCVMILQYERKLKLFGFSVGIGVETFMRMPIVANNWSIIALISDSLKTLPDAISLLNVG